MAIKRDLLAKLLSTVGVSLLVLVYLVNSSPLAYAAVPSVSTSPASSLSQYSATLNGNVTSANGQVISQRGFQYGATTSYGQTTTENVSDPNSYTYATQWGRNPVGNGEFSTPSGIAIDSSGNTYVTDVSNSRIQKFDNTNTYVTKWGSYGTGNGQFNGPAGIAVDSSGNIYVVDQNNRRIQKFTNTGTYLAQWGSFGTGNGQFNSPGGIAVDSSGNVYVSDRSLHRIQKFTSAGTYVTRWGSFGTGNGQFNSPGGIAVDSSSNVYVADATNHRIQKFNNVGTYVNKWGSSGSGNGQFASPSGIAVDGSGNIYVIDAGNGRIQKLTSSGVYSTQWGSSGIGNSQFNAPTGIVLDSSANVLIVDSGNNRIQKFSNTGTYVTQWGRNPTANGQFSYPQGITTDTSGNVYVADSNNNRIQKFDSNGTYLTKWGDFGSANGQFSYPQGITTDTSGNVYVVDDNNRIQKFDSNGNYINQYGQDHLYGSTSIAVDIVGDIYVADIIGRVQKFDSNGNYLTLLGSTGCIGDDVFSDDAFCTPAGITTDSAGNVYVVDADSNRVQKFDSTGNYVTKWGDFGTDNGQFSYPQGITIDASGNIYIVDQGNSRIQKFSASGTYLAKWGSYGTAGGQFSAPSGMTVDGAGNVYVSDVGNQRIQKFTQNLNGGSYTTGVTGLTCETLYHYRAYATNPGGTSYGSDMTLTTTACPQPAVSTGAASGIGSNNATTYYATVAANVASAGDSALTNVGIQYGPTTSYGSSLNNSSGTVGNNSFNLTSLVCETTYHYRAFATNDYGTRYGSDATFTSATCPTPAAVSTGSAYDVQSDNYANFSATIDITISDTGNSLVSQSGVQYGLDTNYGNSENSEGSLGVGIEGVALSNLDCETTYHYRAFATNVYGTVYGDDETFTSSTCPTPAIVETGSPNDVAPDYAEVEAEVIDQGNSELTEVGVEYGLDTNYDSTVSSSGAVLGANIVVLDELYCETTYHYTAFVTNAYGTTYGEDETLTTGICEPDPPTDVIAEIGSASSINISWAAPDFTGMGAIARYDIYYREVGSTDWQVQEGINDATIAELIGLERGVQYEMKVVAVNVNDFESFDSVEVIARSGFSQLRDCEDLQAINNNLGGFFELANNIDCSDTVNWNGGVGFMPLGTCVVDMESYDFSSAFTGILAGNAYTISNLYSNTLGFEDCTAAGLFGVASAALIQDLKLDGSFGSGNIVGSLAAVTQNTDVVNVQISNSSIEGDVIGGLVGQANFNDSFSEYTQRQNSFTGDVTSDCQVGMTYAGGLYGLVQSVGENANIPVTNINSSYSDANITVASEIDCVSYVGGSIGIAQSNTITNFNDIYAAGEIATDLPSGDGLFSDPQAIALDSSGNIYVTDTDNDRVQKFDANGTYVTKWGVTGSGIGRLDDPRAVAVDASGNVYVSDSGNNRIQKFDSSGTYQTQWGSFGTGNGQFDGASGIALDSSGNIYVVDSGNNRIQKFDSSGTYQTQWGSVGSSNSQFSSPSGVAVDTSGNVYITDTDNDRVQKFDANGTYVTKWGATGSGDGQFIGPRGIVTDSSGNVYITDTSNNRIQKFNSSGTYIAQWGSYGTGNGGFQYPYGIASDISGSIYVADSGSNRIQKFNSSGTYIAQWGGNYSLDSIALGGFAGVYFADADNSTVEYSFAHMTMTTMSPQVGGFTGITGDAYDLSTNYFDADLAGTQTCSLLYAMACNTVMGDSSYFYNNISSPPLNEWDFDNLWETTSTLPVFQADAVDTITPISPDRIDRYQSAGNGGNGSNGGGPTALATPEKPAKTSDTQDPSAPAIVANSQPADTKPSGFFERLKELLSKIPEPILRSFPYILFGGLLLGALVMFLQTLLQTKKLKIVNAQLAKQRAIAQQRDTFWHLAANYLRAPITLLMGGVELLKSSPAQTTSATSKKVKNDDVSGAITQLVGNMQSKVAQIMEQIEGSKSLQNITWPKVHNKRVITSLGFWIPMACVAGLTLLANYIARNFKQLDISALQLLSQLVTFFLVGMFVYWTASLLGLSRRKRERAERLLSTQQATLDKDRSLLISKTATALDSDVANLELLTNSLLTKDGAQTILYEGTRRLRQMIDSFALLIKAQNNDLRSLSPPDAHTSLQTVMDDAVHELDAKISAKNLTLIKPKKQKLTVHGSTSLVAQVVSSVLANAVDFSPEGSTLAVKVMGKPGKTVMTIADTGPGINLDQKSHIFQLFTKADGQDALRMDHDGLGINLHLDRQIMDYLGGDIHVDSEAGKGAIVTLTWLSS